MSLATGVAHVVASARACFITAPERDPAGSDVEEGVVNEQLNSEQVRRAQEIEAAEICGVSVSTLRRWQKQAEFASAFDAARSNILQIVSSELPSGSLEAVAFLSTVIRDEKAVLSCRIAASRVVLETAWRVHEFETLANRMSAIEDSLERVQ